MLIYGIPCFRWKKCKLVQESHASSYIWSIWIGILYYRFTIGGVWIHGIEKSILPKSKSKILWGIIKHRLFLAYKGHVFEGRNNIDITRFHGMGMHGLKSYGRIQQFGNEESFISCLETCPNILHLEPIFTKSNKDNAIPNNVSHNNDDSFDGHNSVLVADLHIFGKNGHDDHPHVPSLGCCSCRGTIATLALGPWLKQGLAKVRAKNEAWESHFMFLGM